MGKRLHIWRERQQTLQDSRFGKLLSQTPSGILVIIPDFWYELYLLERICKCPQYHIGYCPVAFCISHLQMFQPKILWLETNTIIVNLWTHISLEVKEISKGPQLSILTISTGYEPFSRVVDLLRKIMCHGRMGRT